MHGNVALAAVAKYEADAVLGPFRVDLLHVCSRHELGRKTRGSARNVYWLAKPPYLAGLEVE